MNFAVTLGEFRWRPLTASAPDTDFVLHVRNGTRAQRAFFSGEITAEEHARFLARAEQRDEINWIIERAGQPIATSGIYDIDWKNGRAEAGRITATAPEVFSPNNVVTCMVAFEHLGLNKIVGMVAAYNQIVSRAGDRFGAVLEGTLRQHIIKEGGPVDVLVYGTLRSDWLRLRPKLLAEFGEARIVRVADGDAC
jgi:RimJ/RimL family protein N-acetyltransferase